jgi:hypothetical protein
MYMICSIFLIKVFSRMKRAQERENLSSISQEMNQEYAEKLRFTKDVRDTPVRAAMNKKKKKKKGQ